MKQKRRLRFVVGLMLLLASLPATADDRDLAKLGFSIGLEELDELLAFQRSVRLEPEAKVLAGWSGRFQDLRLRTIKRSENRYAYALDESRGRQVIAIRGTANLVNAFYDLETWKRRSEVLGIEVHSGFERAASLVAEDVSPFLRREVPILVCGHSLGAAEAIILGMLLSKRGYHIEKILASGPPKVTDAEGWTTFADLPVIRVTAAYDPVPFLPFAKLYPKAPFVQGGPLLMLLDGPYVAVAPSSFYDDLSPAFAELRQISERFTVVDHRVWTYRDRAAEKMGGVEPVPFEDWERYAVPRR